MKNRTATELMTENLIIKHRAGSHAYSTNIATSDEDYRGIFVADPINVRTEFFPIREVEDTTEIDTKFYELSHFMKLCLDQNPNIVESLWTADEDIIFRTPAYDLLRDVRHELLSSKIAFTYSGYAIAQLKRIRGHNKWLNQPQHEKQPLPCDYLSVVQWLGPDKKLKVNLNNFLIAHRLIPFGNDMYGVVQAQGHNMWNPDTGNLNDNFDGNRDEFNNTYLMLVKWNRDEFKMALEKWQQYWTWKKNRNVIRSELEEKFSYDTKHAMHLVRLLRTCKEALVTGEILVKRPDAQELLAIRNGAWTYDELISYAESTDKEIREVLYPNTKLRKTPDVHLAAELVMQVQDMVWSTK